MKHFKNEKIQKKGIAHFDANGGLGAGGWGWVLLGWTGLVLSCTAQNPARLVYGSAALVASLRGQHCHFATLPMIPTI